MRLYPWIVPLLLVPVPSHAADGGVFCKSSMFFIARPEPTGALAFKVMGNTQQGNIIEVGGMALPHAGGWRYQVKSAATLADRCTIDIKENGGGYSIKTIEGARCESYGGAGATALIENVNFLAASRVAGAVPPRGKPNDFPEFDCAHMKYYSEAPASASATRVLGAAPIGVVRGLVMQDTGGWGTIFADKPTAIMREYFTSGFNAAWTKAMSHDEDVLDGDPITGYQMVERVAEVSTSGGETSPATATVVAKLKVTAGGKQQLERVTFDLKLENRYWKIDDIKSGAMPSIRSYFRKSYKT